MHKGWAVLAIATAETIIVISLLATPRLVELETVGSTGSYLLEQDTGDVRIRRYALDSWDPVSSENSLQTIALFCSLIIFNGLFSSIFLPGRVYKRVDALR